MFAADKIPVVVVTQLLPRDGGMAEDHGAPESGKLPRVWTIGRKETESSQRASVLLDPFKSTFSAVFTITLRRSSFS